MTADQERRIRKERRITVVSITILVVLSAALLLVTVRGDVESRRAVEDNIVDRQNAVEAILADVRGLQRCVVELLQIHPDVRATLPAEEISALCPPPDLLVVPDDTSAAPARDPTATVQPADGPDPPPPEPHTQPVPPPPADPPAPAPAPPQPPVEPEPQAAVPQLLDRVGDTVCTLTPVLC